MTDLRVMLVDDEALSIEFMRSLVQKVPGFVVAAECSNGREAIAQLQRETFDVVLMDIRMPEEDGLSALETMRQRHPDMRVVMLSTYDNPTYVARSVALGAADYVLKASPRSQLIGAIERAAAGDTPAEDSVLHQVQHAMSRRRDRGR